MVPLGTSASAATMKTIATTSGTPTATVMNAAKRNFNFITLQWANGGAKYTAKWYESVTRAVSATQPIRSTYPDGGDYAYITADDEGRISAVTDSFNNYIKLVFWGNDNVYTGADPGVAAAQNKWWYNEKDGFFYFIGVVEPGEATPLLLDAISMSPAAGKDYSHMAFDLTVKMEAI